MHPGRDAVTIQNAIQDEQFFDDVFVPFARACRDGTFEPGMLP
jgi:hypothetical protein